MNNMFRVSAKTIDSLLRGGVTPTPIKNLQEKDEIFFSDENTNCINGKTNNETSKDDDSSKFSNDLKKVERTSTPNNFATTSKPKSSSKKQPPQLKKDDDLAFMLGFNSPAPKMQPSGNKKSGKKNSMSVSKAASNIVIFEDNVESTKEESKINEEMVDLPLSDLYCKQQEQVKLPQLPSNEHTDDRQEDTKQAVNSSNTWSPELTYTPGKSRLDKASMARLKEKYGSTAAKKIDDIDITSTKDVNKMKNVTFDSDPVTGSADAPVYSPETHIPTTAFKAPRGSEESNLAGNTPKIRHDYKLSPEGHSATSAVAMSQDQALVSRLWTSQDFVTSPNADGGTKTPPIPSADTQNAALALTQLSVRKPERAQGNTSPIGLPSSLLLQTTPTVNATKEFKQTYDELSTQLNQLEEPVVSQANTNIEFGDIYEDKTHKVDVNEEKDVDIVIESPEGTFHQHTHVHKSEHVSEKKIRIIKMQQENSIISPPSSQTPHDALDTAAPTKEINLRDEIEEKERQIQKLKEEIEKSHNYHLKENLKENQIAQKNNDEDVVGCVVDDGGDESCTAQGGNKENIIQKPIPQTPTTPLTRLRREDFSQSIALAISMLPEGESLQKEPLVVKSVPRHSHTFAHYEGYDRPTVLEVAPVIPQRHQTIKKVCSISSSSSFSPVTSIDKTQEEINNSNNSYDSNYTGISLHKPSTRGRNVSHGTNASTSPNSVASVDHPNIIVAPVYRARKAGGPASPIKKPALAMTPTKQAVERDITPINDNDNDHCNIISCNVCNDDSNDDDDDKTEVFVTNRKRYAISLQEHLSSRGKRHMIVSPPHHLDDKDVSFDAEFGLEELLKKNCGNKKADNQQRTKQVTPSYLGHTKSSEAKRLHNHKDDNHDQGFDVEHVEGIEAVDNDEDASVFTMNTTLSLDDGVQKGSDVIDNDGNVVLVPRLVFSKRSKDIFDPSDIKEIVLKGAIGETTTVELSIFNDRIKTQKIAAKAVQMRYDILASHDAVAKATPSLTPGGGNVTINTFDVTPSTLIIKGGADSVLTVSFRPSIVGLYSGVIKIRSHSKTFTLLLRGEAHDNDDDASQDKNIEAKNTIQRSPLFTSTQNLQQEQENIETEVAPDARDVAEIISDPLVLKQERMKEWLNRSSKKNTDIPPASLFYEEIGLSSKTEKDEFLEDAPKEEDNDDVTVVPSILRLLPLRKQISTTFGAALESTGLFHGDFLVRNFSARNRTLHVCSTTPALVVTSEQVFELGENEARNLNVRFDPSLATVSASNATTVGHVKILADNITMTVEVQMPPTSMMSDSSFIHRDITNHFKNISNLMKYITDNDDNNASAPLSSKFRHIQETQERAEQKEHTFPISMNMDTVEKNDPMSFILKHGNSQDSNVSNGNAELAWKNWELFNGEDFEESDPFDVSGSPKLSKDEVIVKKSQSIVENDDVKVSVSPVVRRMLSSCRKDNKGDQIQLQTSWSPLNKMITSVLPSPSSSSSSPSPQCARGFDLDDILKHHEIAVNKGVHFKDTVAEFGAVEMGSLSRQKIELSNTTGKNVTILIKDPDLPFVTLHNELLVKANSYIQLPIRFVPVNATTNYNVTLEARVASTGDDIKILLRGRCL